MDCYTLIILASMAMVASSWSMPFYPVHRIPQIRVTRFAPMHPRHRFPIRAEPFRVQRQQTKPERPKRDYDYEEDEEEQNHDNRGTSGVTGPVHTFVKTDKNANYKWGVRHHVGNKYAS